MKKYIYIFIIQFQTVMEYKFNLITSIFSNFLTMFISYSIWNAIYFSSDKTVIGDYSKTSMLTYIILVNVLSIIFSFDYIVRLSSLIRTGRLSTLLLRPISLIGESLANFLGTKIVYIVFLLILLLLSKTNFLLCLLYFLIIFIMFFLLISATSTIGFWLIQMWPLRPVLSGIYGLLGGLYFPLNLLPQSIYQVIIYNPFALIGYHAANIFQGMYTTQYIIVLSIVSIFWIILFDRIYKFLLLRGLKKYEGMGA